MRPPSSTLSASVVLAIALGLGGLPAPAWASDASRAEDLIRRANDLRRRGQDPEAFPLFQEAYRIAHSPRTAAQLGLVELSLSYWVESERHLAEALATTNNGWVDRNRKVLEESLSSARAHLGTVIVDGSPTGAEVRVNDTVAGNLPLAAPIRVVEGQVAIDVQASGYQRESRTVVVTAKTTQHLSFQLVPAAAKGRSLSSGTAESGQAAVATPAGPPSSHDEASRLGPALPWMFVAATGIAAGLAVWQHVAWQQDVGAFDRIGPCARADPMRGADSRCQGLYDRYTSERTRALVAYGFAGACAITSAVLFMTREPSAPEKGPTQGLVTGPGTVGIGWRGTF